MRQLHTVHWWGLTLTDQTKYHNLPRQLPDAGRGVKVMLLVHLKCV